MPALRKITVNLPADLVESAQRLHGKNLTETIRDALVEQEGRDAWEALGALRGKIAISDDWRELAGKYDDEDE